MRPLSLSLFVLGLALGAGGLFLVRAASMAPDDGAVAEAIGLRVADAPR